MTAVALNNLLTYLRGLALPLEDRKWIAEKLIEPSAEELKAERQKQEFKESFCRALDEVARAERGETKLTTDEEFLAELRQEGIL